MEQEIWGVFPDQTVFSDYIIRFTQQFGKPKQTRRISISFWDPHINKNVDTRIRITDGDAELIQKSGTWENEDEIHSEEISVSLPNDATHIHAMYKILRNNLPLTKSPFVAQYYNHLFYTEFFEIKLSEMHGKKIRYTFEIERLAEYPLGLLHYAEKIGLDTFVPKTTSIFWEDWANEMDVRTDDLSDQQLHKMISDHLILN